MLDDNIINNIISQSITALHFCVEPKCSLVEAHHNILQIKREEGNKFFFLSERKKIGFGKRFVTSAATTICEFAKIFFLSEKEN